ncbi:MAG: hypothetical protein R3F07_08395 [Opitutaceae bacterium]
MIQPSTKKLEQALADVDGITRRLAVVLRGISDFGSFFEALEDFFGWVSSESGRTIHFSLPVGSPDQSDQSFATPELTSPVESTSGTGGFIRIAPPSSSRPFGPQDLHLLGALTDFTAALLEVAETLQADRRTLMLLRFVYDQLPIGILCFDQDGSLLLRNAQVPRIDGTGGWGNREETVSSLEAHSVRKSTIDPDHLQYVLPSGSGQNLVDLRTVERPAGAGFTVVIFGPMTADRGALREHLDREVYRCRWLGLPLTLVVLRAGSDLTPLLARLPELRAQLGEEAICDVLDASTLGLIAPRQVPREALSATRRVAGLGGLAPLTLGWSRLEGEREEPQALIERALESLRPAGDLLGRRLLVFDRYAAITDMIEMVVRNEFHIDKTADASVAGRLLESLPYDGLIAECDPEEGDMGIQLLDTARRLHPGMTTIATTTRIDLRAGVDPVPRWARVLNKPFTLSGMRASLGGLLDEQPDRPGAV